jgi:pre-mRNA-processing factor 40
MYSDRRTSSISPENLHLIFNRLREKVLRRNDKDQQVQRRAIDNLRSRIKHLDPPVSPSDTYEQVRPRIEKFDEYHALDSDDSRKQAFDKVIRRLKERDDEDRERRDRRSHDSQSRHRPRHRSRSGDRDREREREQDAYAADRKKAQQDRERQYRKGSYFGLSPPPSTSATTRRDASDRYVPGEAAPRNRSRERERGDRYSRGSAASYLSRADPREAATAAELDYGDGSSTTTVKASSNSGRRRRDSEEEGDTEERDAKRRKSEEEPADKTEEKPEDVAYRSGSEEGEIEEDE